jgi:putative endonuclease
VNKCATESHNGAERADSELLRLHRDEPLTHPLHRRHQRLGRRVYEHRTKKIKGFTSRYNINRLVYYETFRHIESAIEREKQLKGWLRIKKIELIESKNKYWVDLAKDWYPAMAVQERTCSHSESADVRWTVARRTRGPSEYLRMTALRRSRER